LADGLFAGDLVDDFTSKNILCVPLRDKQQKVFGVLQAINRLDDRGFDDRDVSVFEALADHVAIAIERTRELEDVKNQLNEKEMMLTEVHHRLKNNLSTITALIEMELSDVEDETARRVLRKTASRIEAMTGVHDFLYNRNLGNQIDLKSYLQRLTAKISETLAHSAQEITIEVEAETVQIDTERTMSCGLLLNELMVNCYKHAFKKKSNDCRITVQLEKSDNDYITLQVSDNGIGIGEEFSVEDADSIGGWLINVLIRRLEASVDIKRTDGTTFIIRFKK
jgi:two-component sensor histidine kinase